MTSPPRPTEEIQSYVRNLGHRALQLQPLVAADLHSAASDMETMGRRWLLQCRDGATTTEAHVRYLTALEGVTARNREVLGASDLARL